MDELSSLPNIGAVLENQLNSVGISNPEQLCEIGAKDAWLRIKATDPSACMHRLLALEGAVQGVKKVQLSPENKADLKAFFNAHKA